MANPIASLPVVISPAKGGYVGKEEGEDSVQQDSVKHSVHGDDGDSEDDFEMEQDSVQQDLVQHDVHGNDGDSEDDFDFSDSDYDLEGDDDDIFVDYVDEDVTEETGSKGQQKGKGKKAVGSKLKGKKVSSLAIYGEELTDEFELELPESDEEGQGLRFKSFISEDIDNPIFKVGMIFESVEMLRKAITKYSMKQMV